MTPTELDQAANPQLDVLRALTLYPQALAEAVVAQAYHANLDYTSARIHYARSLELAELALALLG